LLALSRARSSILGGRLAVSVLREAARFLVKRAGGETGVGGSGIFSACTTFAESPPVDSVEMLLGDLGVSRFDGSPLAVFGMMDSKDNRRREARQVGMDGE
jgi:hypothetical protein